MTFPNQISAGQANAATVVNEELATLAHQACYGKKASTTTGLTWGYYGGRWGGFSVSDGTLSLTASNTNYLVVAIATGVISASTSNTNWNNTTDYVRVYKLTTSGSAVTATEDHRAGPGGVHGGGGGGGGAVDSVNGQTGTVVLDAGDIGITDAAGDFTATDVEGALAELQADAEAHLAASDPHPQYLTQTEADALYAAIGSGGSTQGKHAIYIAAGSMSPSVTGGCASLAGVATSSGQPDLRTLDFDTTTQEFAQFGIVMPKSWNEGTVTFRAHWSHASTTTNFGVAWELQGVAISDDDAIATSFGTAQTVTDTGGTTNDLYTTAESSAITIAGTPAAEDMVFFRVARAPANGSDTMAIDARLHGITVYITTNADTDA